MDFKKAWNSSDNSNDAKVLEVSPVQNMLLSGSPPIHHCDKGAGVPHEQLVQHLSPGPGPLGLRLRISASLVNMIQMELDDQASRKKARYATSDTHRGVVDTTSLTKPKLKPSMFFASILRIGTREWKSRYDGDLVAKFYYTNCKLIWEILSKGLKSKIEIDWKTISALKVNCRGNEPGTLEITLSQDPIFYEETKPQPRMSTKWRRTQDFTGGQARMHRKHVLQCAPGILDEHIVKLLSSDHRLYALSQKNTIDPLFEQFHSEREVPESSTSVQDLRYPYNHRQFEQQQFGEPVSISFETNTVGINNDGSQDIMHVLIPSSVPVKNKKPMTPSGDLQLHRDMSTCNNSSSPPTPPQAQLNDTEKILHGPLNDTNDTETREAIGEALIMWRVNSFSSLLHQDPAPAAVHAAGDPPVNIEAEAPAQVLDGAPPGSSGQGNGNNGLLPSTDMESLPWELEPAMWDIDMDTEFLSEFLHFSP